MRIFTIAILVNLINIGNTYAQVGDTYYSIKGKMLGPSEYDKTKRQENPCIRLNQLETVEMFGDSIKIVENISDGETLEIIEQITFRNGDVGFFDGYETIIVGYYPELNGIVVGDCNADYMVDMNSGEILYSGIPEYDYTSPSGKYRITYIKHEDIGYVGSYILQKKVNGKYKALGSLVFDKARIDGIYWADDEEIHFMGAGQSEDDYWLAYEGRIRKEQQDKK